MSDTSLVFTLVARERVSQTLGSVAGKLEAFGARITGAVAGVGAATPYVAAAVTAAGALAAGAAAAGAAVGAFKAAAAPQLEEVTTAWTLYDAAQKAAAEGGKKATQAQEAYTQALAQMTPATRATATEFIGLKNDFAKWSDSLSGTTMPIFTRGVQALRAALPALTPLVKSAAGAIGGFVDEIAAGLKSNGFKAWIADFSAAAGPALSSFLTVVKNLAVGVGALLHAFLPMSAGVTGGLATMSQAFANWAKGLEDSAGFARFLDLANSGKGALGNLATALGQLLVSLAPFMGATTLVAQGLADIIGAIPPEVISVLAQAFIAASVGMKAWAIATSIWSGVQRVATAAQWAMNSALLASPITWIVIGIVALVAAIVLIATKTTWFQQLWHAAWSGIQTAVSAVWGWIKTNWPLLLAIITGPIGLAVLAVVKNWDTIKSATITAWNTVVGFIKAIPGTIVSLFLNWTLPGLIIKHWDSIKSGTIRVATAIVSWVKGLPGKIAGAVSPLGSRLWNTASSAWNRFRTATAERIVSAISLVRGLPGRAKSALGNLGGLLYNSGRALIRGFINGIKNMIGSVRNAASSIVSAARDYFPFSPAKVGPFSGSGWTLYSGRSLIQGLADGITERRGVVTDAMAGVTQAASDAVPSPSLTTGRAPVVGAGTRTPPPVVIQLQADGSRAASALLALLREAVVPKGGNVQFAVTGRNA